MSTITIVGQLAEDPTIRFTQGGRAVANLVVLENTRHRTPDGDWVDDDTPNRYRVVVWGPPAEHLADSVRKGDRIMAQGSIKTEAYEKDGIKRTQQVITADEIAASFRYASLTVNRTPKDAGGREIDPGE